MRLAPYPGVTRRGKALRIEDGRTFENPVLPGFHPDPSVCRVGDAFYLVTSSFEYFPGIPVFTSLNLVHWAPIGHVLDRAGQLDLRGARTSGGIYAPTIRWHGGMFFVTATNVSAGGHFIVHGEDPRGPWSDPVWVDQDGIDPSLFFEGDTVYFTSNVEADVAGPHVTDAEFERGIQQCLINPITGKRLSPTRFIWGGTGGKFPEAPHLYRRGGFYYLVIAEGGTEYGHFGSVARSRSPWGPFEPSPYNPLLSHSGSPNPVQAVGHADLVELDGDEWWLVCLGIRPRGNWYHHNLGRETFLAPVTWTSDGWPTVRHAQVQMREQRPRRLPSASPLPSPATHHEWNTVRTPLDPVVFSRRPNWLSLTGRPATLDELHPSFLGRRQQHSDFSSSAGVDFDPQEVGDEAGLVVRMSESHHFEIAVVRRGNTRVLMTRLRVGSIVQETVHGSIPDGLVTMHIDCVDDSYTLGAATLDGPVRVTGDAVLLSSEVAGGFTGVYIGIYCTSQTDGRATIAYFRDFKYYEMPRLPVTEEWGLDEPERKEV
ncbi:glycoside hydrolase family 43 protein [Georgenia halophila]|uniref:Glycoside hydrolase family 43 protein n=2 Tax=Georgenia halophila TaxID=620889 RepID=A0ABP8LFF0_9MICO